MVHGSWFMVHGSWFMVHGSWFMVHGSWFINGIRYQCYCFGFLFFFARLSKILLLDTNYLILFGRSLRAGFTLQVLAGHRPYPLAPGFSLQSLTLFFLNRDSCD
jgi:hypothetical protein